MALNTNKKNSRLKSCSNPVFEKWIEEMRDDAIARELQSKHTFTKVCSLSRKKITILILYFNMA